jgi:DNA helicase-2/ATP-dependent DNA helicase PcrA
MQLLTGLNPQQQAAVTAPTAPTLVLAGPGSGKTRVLTLRITYLIEQLGIAPYHILAVTFTNKAAKEMRSRLELRLGALRGLTVGTFHGICTRILRREAAYLPVNGEFVIFDGNDQQVLLKSAMAAARVDEKQVKPQKLQAAISNAKNELLAPEDLVVSTAFSKQVQAVYSEYQRLLRANNAFDFDDLLLEVVRLFQEQPMVLEQYRGYFRQVLVDEFQDTNLAQYTILRQLTQPSQQLYAVGDVDQAIYRWRGADYRNLQRFQHDYPTAQTILLEENYRSTQAILDVAMAVIDKNPARIPKKLFTQRGSGEKVQIVENYDEAEEALMVVNTIQDWVRRGVYQLGDFAVMYRTNAQSRSLEDAFVRANVPYRLVGATRFYARKEIKDLLAYLRLIHNPLDQVSLQRIINLPPRGIGDKTLDLLQQIARTQACAASQVLADLAEQPLDSPLAAAFGARAAKPLREFGLLLRQWWAARAQLNLLQLCDLVLNSSGLNVYLNDGSPEGLERWANILEFRKVLGESSAVPLGTFLEEISLLSDVDNLQTEDQAATTLLTLHAAKGLEFRVVFLIGLNDGLLPHLRTLEDVEELSEERRLFYVGITRAKERLYLLYSFRRAFGDTSLGQPSRFLFDIPADLLRGNVPQRSGYQQRPGFQKATTWQSSPRPNPPPAATNRAVPFRLNIPSVPAKPVAPQLRYQTGQNVRHPEFGEGVVLESKLVGSDELLTIAFQEVGLKRLVASLAKLQVL